MLFELKHLNKTFNEIISRAPYQNYYEADSDSWTDFNDEKNIDEKLNDMAYPFKGGRDIYLELVWLAMLDEKVDELGRVLHEVNILVHCSVHDQQPPLLLRQLSDKI